MNRWMDRMFFVIIHLVGLICFALLCLTLLSELLLFSTVTFPMELTLLLINQSH